MRGKTGKSSINSAMINFSFSGRSMMFLKRISAALLLLSVSSVASTLASAAEDDTENAVNLLAIESLCVKANPDSNSSVENALNSDPETTDSLRAEVRRVKADPASKAKIQSLAFNMSNSVVVSKLPDMCSYYLPKK